MRCSHHKVSVCRTSPRSETQATTRVTHGHCQRALTNHNFFRRIFPTPKYSPHSGDCLGSRSTRMLPLKWNSCCVVFFLVASLRTVTHQVSAARPKANSIKPGQLGETVAPATNHSSVSAHGGITKKHNLLAQQVYPCSNDKECSVGSYCHSPQHAPSRCLNCRRRKKRCHRDAMCCPGNRCSNYICVPISESVLSHHISPLDEQNKLSHRKNGKAHSKLKGHEGDPCLRSSDCSDGYCCARHFWTKICKPVLRLSEVCTKQRKKGSHGLEIFQRCDCAKGLSCKVWKDATSSSKSRLHMCQKI